MKRIRVSVFLLVTLATAVAAVPATGSCRRFDPKAGHGGCDDGEFLVDTSIACAPTYGSNPAIAFDGTNSLVVSSDARKSSDLDIFGVLVRPDGTALDSVGIAITTSRGNDLDPAVAFNGTNFLVVWTDDSTGLSHVYGARVARDGTGRVWGHDTDS